MRRPYHTVAVVIHQRERKRIHQAAMDTGQIGKLLDRKWARHNAPAVAQTMAFADIHLAHADAEVERDGALGSPTYGGCPGNVLKGVRRRWIGSLLVVAEPKEIALWVGFESSPHIDQQLVIQQMGLFDDKIQIEFVAERRI